jgi:hypothetical protein
MTTTLEEQNASLRNAVLERLNGTPAESCCEGGACHVPPARASESVATRTLQRAVDTVRDRHTKYGPPTRHFARTAAMVNAAFGTGFTAADWALVMVLDKVARQMGPEATDDAAIDIAGYAACHEECRRGS